MFCREFVVAGKHLGLKRKLNKVIDQIHGEKVPTSARSAIETDGTASVFLYRFNETAAIEELGNLVRISELEFQVDENVESGDLAAAFNVLKTNSAETLRQIKLAYVPSYSEKSDVYRCPALKNTWSSGLVNLKSLEIDSIDIGDKTLVGLANHQSLWSFDFTKVPLSAKAIRNLATVSSLNLVMITNCSGVREKHRELLLEIPGIRAVYIK